MQHVARCCGNRRLDFVANVAFLENLHEVFINVRPPTIPRANVFILFNTGVRSSCKNAICAEGVSMTFYWLSFPSRPLFWVKSYFAFIIRWAAPAGCTNWSTVCSTEKPIHAEFWQCMAGCSPHLLEHYSPEWSWQTFRVVKASRNKISSNFLLLLFAPRKDAYTTHRNQVLYDSKGIAPICYLHERSWYLLSVLHQECSRFWNWGSETKKVRQTVSFKSTFRRREPPKYVSVRGTVL